MQVIWLRLMEIVGRVWTISSKPLSGDRDGKSIQMASIPVNAGRHMYYSVSPDTRELQTFAG